MREKVTFFLFFLCCFGFAQNKSPEDFLHRAILDKSDSFSRIEDFKKARDFFIDHQWDSTLVYTSKLLAVADYDKELYNYCYLLRAISFREKSLHLKSKESFSLILPSFYFIDYVKMDLGRIEFREKNFSKALNHYLKIDSIKHPENLGIQKYGVYQNIGLCYMYLKEYDKAEEYLLTTLKYRESTNDTVNLYVSYSGLANLYYFQYKDDQAIPYFVKAYNWSKLMNGFKEKSTGALNMAVVEENRKNYSKALVYRKEYEQWKDSLNDQNRIYETAQLEKKIAVDQKEQEVQLLEAENKAKEAQNRLYLFSGILAFILLIIVYFFYRGTVKRNKIITAQKEDLDQLNATKDKLFSIVSHDLRSSVNAIKTSNKKLLGNLESQNKKEISENLKQNSSIVNGAYGLLDNLLNWALLQTKQSYFEMTELSLSRIVDHVAFNYQSILEEKEIAYISSISKKEQVFADQESLKIVLRNLLDNAIKFTKEGGNIHIYSEYNDHSYVHLIVEDSGIGMDEETRKELLIETQLLSKKKHEDFLGTGLGLHLVKSMIAKNQGKFHIESEEGKGTKMIVSLLKPKNS